MPIRSGNQGTAAEREFYLGLTKELQSRQRHDSAWFKANLVDAKLRPEMRQALMIPLQNYYEFTGRDPEVFQLIAAWHREFHPQMPLMIGTPRVNQPLQKDSPLKTASLLLKHYKPVQLPVLADSELHNLTLLHAFYRDNRLWIEGRCFNIAREGFVTPKCGLFYGIDLAKDQQDVVVFDAQHMKVPEAEVMGDTVIVKTGSLVKAYGLHTKSHRDIRIEADEDARLVHLADKLFLVSTNSVASVNLESGETHLLASVRRRPAQTPLDELPSLYPAQLLAGPSNGLCFQADRSFYSFDVKQGWHQLASLDDKLKLAQSFVLPQADGKFSVLSLMLEAGPIWEGFFPKLFLWDPAKPAPQYLVGPQAASNLPGQSSLPVGSRPQWTVAQTPIYDRSSYVWVGTDLWVSGFDPALGQPGHPGLVLVCFRPEPNGVFVVKTSFDQTIENAADFQEHSRNHFTDYKLVRVAGGLVALCAGGNGYWFIPEADLSAALQAAQ